MSKERAEMRRVSTYEELLAAVGERVSRIEIDAVIQIPEGAPTLDLPPGTTLSFARGGAMTVGEFAMRPMNG